MPGIDESLTFYPLRIAVLTVSDTRTDETDKSGALLAGRLTAAGHTLAGKATSLSGSSKLPLTNRQGVFVFVTIGNDLLGAIQKHAHSKMLQLGLRSLAVDVGEVAGTLTATARAEMRTADQAQKAKSILDGLQAMASLADDPMARSLLDGVTISTNGLAVEVVAKLPLSVITKIIQNHHP